MLGMTRENRKQNENRERFSKCLFFFRDTEQKTKLKKNFLRMEILSEAYAIEH